MQENMAAWAIIDGYLVTHPGHQIAIQYLYHEKRWAVELQREEQGMPRDFMRPLISVTGSTRPDALAQLAKSLI